MARGSCQRSWDDDPSQAALGNRVHVYLNRPREIQAVASQRGGLRLARLCPAARPLLAPAPNVDELLGPLETGSFDGVADGRLEVPPEAAILHLPQSFARVPFGASGSRITGAVMAMAMVRGNTKTMDIRDETKKATGHGKDTKQLTECL